jgi:hypothetical protein
MLRLTAALAVALAAFAVAASGSPAATPAKAQAEKCGKHIVNGSGWFHLKAEKTSCKVARKLADHFVFKAGGESDGFHDWVCAKAQVGDEVWTVQCSRSLGPKHQLVTFKFGA